MEQVKDFLTYADVVESGACLGGTIEACKEHGNIFFGSVEDMLVVFEGEEDHILKAAGLSGYGDGSVYGSGSGDGYGYGYSSGSGDGYGSGYGSGSGDGSGDGYGDGDGSI